MVKELLETRRVLNKIDCLKCGATGLTYSVKKVKCRSCVGKGWVEPEAKQEKICPECDGLGQIDDEYEEACDQCLGKGYLVQINEVQIYKEECSCQKETDYPQETIECGRCQGVGVDPVFGLCTYCMGGDENCDICEGNGQLKVDGDIEEYMEIPCRRCKGLGGKALCLKCGGKKYQTHEISKDITPR